MIVETLERDNFIHHYSDKITEITTALRLDPQNTTNSTNFYEQIASWVIDNYPAIKYHLSYLEPISWRFLKAPIFKIYQISQNNTSSA